MWSGRKHTSIRDALGDPAPLRKGQTSHSLDSGAESELGLELDKAHQSSGWGETLTPEVIEYAAKDV